MNKTFKILLVTFLFVFLIFTGKCLAVNIHMNLASNLADNNSNIVDDNEIDNSTTDNSVASNTATSTSFWSINHFPLPPKSKFQI